MSTKKSNKPNFRSMLVAEAKRVGTDVLLERVMKTLGKTPPKTLAQKSSPAPASVPTSRERKIVVKTVGKMLRVSTPFPGAFVSNSKGIPGRTWVANEGVTTFPVEHKKAVLAAILNSYNATRYPYTLEVDGKVSEIPRIVAGALV